MRQAIPCFSQFVCSNAYVQYVCEQILPKHELKPLAEAEADGAIKENFELQPILEGFAEICAFIQPTNTNLKLELPTAVRTVFDKLFEYLPEPKLPSLEEDGKSGEPEEDFQFTYIEGLLFALHAFGKKSPDAFVEDVGGAERFREFKRRLQYLARGCQNYIKRLQEALRLVKNPELLKSDENRLKQTALKCIQNINALIRDLFYPKPQFKSQITLSWKVAAPVVNPLQQSPANRKRKLEN